MNSRKKIDVKSLFINVYAKIKALDRLLFLFIGGRGVGKTYSMLVGHFEDFQSYENPQNHKVMYLRRLATDIEKCCTTDYNPYKKINADKGWHIEMKRAGESSLIYDFDDEGHPIHIGYGFGLSTFSGTRGVDFSDVDLVIYDEFINIKKVNTMADREFSDLMDLIETINRNREILGEKSIKVVCLSNANTIDDGLIRALHLGEEIHQIQVDEGYGIIDYPDRELHVEILETPKEFKDLKSQTKLYKMTKGTKFYDMAIENQFTKDHFGDVKILRYNELIPLVAYENIYFYRHKSNDLIFASYRRCNCRKYSELNLKAFKQDYGFMIGAYIERGKILYRNYDVKLDVKNMWK